MIRRFAALVAAVLIVGLVLSACGKSGGGGGESAGGVKAGPGVTDKQITLGVLTDLTAVFGPLGQSLTDAQQAYWKEQNAAGGVCGRKVKLIVKDHGYDPQKAVTLYRDMEPDIASLQQLLGSPVAVALLPTLQRDSMLTQLSAWPPSLLKAEQIEITGTTYDVEAINGIDWLMANKGLKSGDKIGDLYFEGDYGECGLKGVKYAAAKHGLKVVEQKIKATDTDMSAAVAAFKRAGVSAIWVTTGAKQLASAAGVAKSVGLNVPIGSNGPSFSPQLLDTPVGKSLEANLTSFASVAPFSLDKPAVKKAGETFKRDFPKGVQQQSVIAGWAMSEVTKKVLDKACANKDLTREGLVKAYRGLSNVDTGGIVAAPMDFTKLGEPSTRAVYVLKTDKSQPGGQRALGGPYTSPTAKSYQESGT
jgi:ABC-type branched-subunit amino acid transport system substrate-binding protein